MDFVARKPFAFLHPLVWCVMIDALDFLETPLQAFLAATGIGLPVGLALNTVIDLIQTFLGLTFFEGGIGLVGLIDIPLPQGLDLFPTYTATYAFSMWQKATSGDFMSGTKSMKKRH